MSTNVKQIVSTEGKPLVAEKPKTDLSAVSGTDALIAMAIDKDLDLDRLQRLIDMKDREETKTAKATFNAAMARVQAKILPILADAENQQTHSRYSKLTTIVSTLAPIYTAEGFSVSFGRCDCSSQKLIDDGWFCTTSELSHTGGFTKNYAVDLPADIFGPKGNVNKTVIHGTKSSISYSRVILMGLMFNFTTTMDVDNDGNTNPAPPPPEATAEQLASIQDFKDAGSIPDVTQAWIDKQSPLTEKAATGLLKKLNKAK